MKRRLLNRLALAGAGLMLAPIARALLKARVGDEVPLFTPAGQRMLEVLEVTYPEAGSPV